MSNREFFLLIEIQRYQELQSPVLRAYAINAIIQAVNPRIHQEEERLATKGRKACNKNQSS